MGNAGRLRTHFPGVFGFGGPSIEEIAHMLAVTPELAQTVTRLNLRGSSNSLSINHGVSLVEILRSCSNVEHLQFGITLPALDALAASGIRLDRLRGLRLECCDPDIDLVARLLRKMPNVRTVSLGSVGLVTSTGQKDDVPRPPALLPHLASYTQTSSPDLFLEPLFSASPSLSALTLFTRHALPDLSRLTALTRLHLKITGRGPTPLDASVHAALVGCSRLRRLDVTCVDVADESLFAAVAALGPRLATLSIHVVGSRSAAGEVLAVQLVPLVRGPLTRLRDLQIWVEFVGDDGMRLLREKVGGACRARRVRFALKNYSYE